MSIFQLLNGLTFAALLFVVASGFTLIFGLLRIVNLAHGALYLFGGYIGFAEKNVPQALEAQAQRGVRACPERALKLIDDASKSSS